MTTDFRSFATLLSAVHLGGLSPTIEEIFAARPNRMERCLSQVLSAE